MSDPDDTLAQLYRAPLSEFVATRKRLAQALRQAGDKEGAAALAKRPKPRPAAWVANQLYYDEPEALAGARGAAAALAGAQAQGGQTLAAMQSLSSAHQNALRRLTELGQARAVAADMRLSRSQTRELQDTLAAWSANPAGVTLGRLHEVLAAPSFDLLDMAAVIAARPPAPSSDAAPAPPEDATRTARTADLRRAQAAAREARKLAEAAVAQRNTGVVASEARLKGAEAQLAALREQLANLERKRDRYQDEIARARAAQAAATAELASVGRREAELAAELSQLTSSEKD